MCVLYLVGETLFVMMCFVCSGSDGRHPGGDLLEGEDGDRGGERAHCVGSAPRAAVRCKCPASHSVTRAIRATRPLVPYLRTCLIPPVRPALPLPPRPEESETTAERTAHPLRDTTPRISHTQLNRRSDFRKSSDDTGTLPCLVTLFPTFCDNSTFIYLSTSLFLLSCRRVNFEILGHTLGARC